MYRNIWDFNSGDSPAVGDYVSGPYGEQGIILKIDTDTIYVGQFGEDPQHLLREVGTLDFPRRWAVCR